MTYFTKEGLYYRKLEDKNIQCQICPHFCKLALDEIGICMGRRNEGGKMIATNYSQIVSLSVDPIEKKPLYHFKPGTMILSTAGNSCNFKCDFCQNYSISQQQIRTQQLSPDDLVEYAIRENSEGIAYTYTEPLVWYEFVLEASQIAHSKQISNVFVSNGYINPKPFKELLPFIDAMNIDLKSIRDDFYKNICEGSLKPVQKTIETAYANGVLIELTNLIIPGLNDSKKDLQDLVSYIASISSDIPLHFSAYYPTYKRNNPRTTDNKLKEAFNIAKNKLNYVYVGNTRIDGTTDTYCPFCGNLIIQRGYFAGKIIGLKKNQCNQCGKTLPIII